MSDEVTGGDLNHLRLATNALVDLASTYSIYSFSMAQLPEADEGTYGRTHTWWTYVASELETTFRFTHDRLYDGAEALLDATRAYTYIDGDNSKSLTEAGKEFAKFLNDPDKAGENPWNANFNIHTWAPAPDLDATPEDWEEK